MKKAILLSLALAFPLAAQAAATAVCTGTGTGGDQTVTATSGNFIVNGFTMKCSANVFLGYDESATAVGVAAASKKGKNIFGGGSAGGQVKQISACSGECDGTEVGTAATTALGGSS